LEHDGNGGTVPRPSISVSRSLSISRVVGARDATEQCRSCSCHLLPCLLIVYLNGRGERYTEISAKERYIHEGRGKQREDGRSTFEAVQSDSCKLSIDFRGGAKTPFPHP
jgi:hypothetical protein